MGYAGRVAALAVITVLAACGGATQSPVARVTPAASPVSSPPLGVCDAMHRCLALVTLRGSNAVVVRDVTDIEHPTTIATLGAITPGFVSANRISYILDGGIVTAPVSGSPVTPVAAAAREAASLAWSPDGTSLVYTIQRESIQGGAAVLEVHLLHGGSDRVVGSTPAMGSGGCEFISSCTLPNWLDSRLTFSPDGKHFSFVGQGFGASYFYVWSADGTPVIADTSHTVTMSSWSAQSLYFRGSAGVLAWKDGVGSTFMPGVQWIKPSASPAGGKIAYTIRDAAGWGHIFLVDTSTGQPRELKAERTDAVFLTTRYLWYRGERACVPADQCGTNPPFHPSNGKTYIYDLQTGTEYESIITNVYDVWPHAA